MQSLALPDQYTINYLPYKPKQFFTCGFCGKKFVTRFYLDRHLDQHHANQIEGNNDHNTRNNHSWICPGTTLCNALGGHGACQQMALEQEPYYDRGSSGYGRDASAIRSKLSRIAHQWQCDDGEMLRSRTKCVELMESCFTNSNEGVLAAASTTISQELVDAVCDRLTCQDALHRLLGGVRQHVHAWDNEWNMHHNHTVGFWGVLLMVCLFVFYAQSALHGYHKKQKRRRTHNRLFVRGNKPKPSWFGSFTKRKQPRTEVKRQRLVAGVIRDNSKDL